jgi:hypothetical protein
MSVSDVRKEKPVTSPTHEQAAQSIQYNTEELVASTWLHKGESHRNQGTQDQNPAGDPRVLLASRLLAAGALSASALIHARLAFGLGVAGMPLGTGQLFLLNAIASAVLAVGMFTRSTRVWLFAVVLSGAGLLGILASVYFPVASVGPFPAIDEPTWLLTKAACALAELTVIALWLVRRIAPVSSPE